LRHLKAQATPADLAWELILVDNASTDNTADYARQFWSGDAPAPIQILRENRPGISFARQTGVLASNYSLIAFVDDDNWLAPDWIANACAIMQAHPEAALCNGIAEAAFEGVRPAWFSSFAGNYAVSEPGWPVGDVTNTLPVPFGAGLCVRRAALDRLHAEGFQHLLSGRTTALSMAGEDTELCIALRMAGWRWRREPSLRMHHWMPNVRMTWDYCLKLAFGGGASSVCLSLYEMLEEPAPTHWRDRLRQTWPVAYYFTILSILPKWKIYIQCLLNKGAEGDPEVFAMQSLRGRLFLLRKLRGQRDSSLAAIRQAEWYRKRPLDKDPKP
jgi:cellulose synthase/poly-beta-1,6-N-acetylglucosamine synthase-like glycosyltransferase